MTANAAEHDAAGLSGPSAAGSVVLDLGPQVGALVLYAPADLDGAEIEISPGDDPAARRTHSLVRKRDCGGPDPGSVSFAAVYPGLRAGSYTIWRGDGTPAGVVTITGSRVANWHWPVP
jgi:hypothetical protein